MKYPTKYQTTKVRDYPNIIWGDIYDFQSPSLEFSRIIPLTFEFDADSTDLDFDVESKSELDGDLSGILYQASLNDRIISAALSSVAVVQSEVPNNGTDVANITVYAINTLGDPAVGIPAADLGVTVSGSNNTLTAVDSETDYTGACRFTLSSTTAQVKTITATILDLAITDDATVEFTGTLGAPDQLWGADYSTQSVPSSTTAVLRDTVSATPLGAWANSTTYAVDDIVSQSGVNYQCRVAHTSSTGLNQPGTGSAWQTYWYSLTKFNVISADASSNGEIIAASTVSSENFRAANILKVYGATNVRDFWIEPAVRNLPIQAVGEIRNFRWEYSHREPAGLPDGAQHPVQDGFLSGSIGAQNWGFHTQTTTLGFTCYFGFGNGYSGTPANYDRWYPGGGVTPTDFTRATCYTIEVQLYRLLTDFYRAHVWIWDNATSTLIVEDADVLNTNASASLADDPSHGFNNNAPNRGIEATQGWCVGCNGVGGSPTPPLYSSNQGAYVIVNSLPERTYIGLYPGTIQEGA